MHQGKHTGEDNAWRVFQAGHTGWWWTNARGVVCRRPYPDEASACAAMKAERRDES